MSARVLVCGSRNWDDANLITSILTGLYNESTIGHLTVEMSEFVVIEGGARGADAVASWWAQYSPLHSHNEREDDVKFEHLCFPAEWEKYGKQAGYIRNKQMLDEGKPDLVLAFRMPGVSKGTDMMVGLAEKAAIKTYVISPPLKWSESDRRLASRQLDEVIDQWDPWKET